MQLKTEVEKVNYKFQIDYKESILSLGSCFSVNIGEKIKQNGISIEVNPFGNLYNPISIYNIIINIINKKQYTKEDFFYDDNFWNSYNFSSLLSNTNLSLAIETANDKILSLHDYLKKSNYLFITFGTAFVYELKETKEIVSNCHKQSGNLFNYYLLSVEEIVEKWSTVIEKIHEFVPQIQIIFTISPVKYFKDSIINNSISKSTLVLACDKLCRINSTCNYFPAFEIVNEELRDYRFFANDMLHVSETAREYIWEIFQKSVFSKRSIDYMSEIEKINNAMGHKSISPDSQKYKDFCREQIKKIIFVEEKYEVSLASKKEFFLQKINS